MLLYLVRHGEAKPKEADPERPLSPRGVEQVKRAARALARLRPAVQVIWHSGKRRAEQTAALFAEALGAMAGSAPCSRGGLDPEDPPELLLRELQEQQRDLLIVGHLPHLARLATALILDREAPQALDLPAAAVVCLERNVNGWALKWLLTPELCP